MEYLGSGGRAGGVGQTTVTETGIEARQKAGRHAHAALLRPIAPAAPELVVEHDRPRRPERLGQGEQVVRRQARPAVNDQERRRGGVAEPGRVVDAVGEGEAALLRGGATVGVGVGVGVGRRAAGVRTGRGRDVLVEARPAAEEPEPRGPRPRPGAHPAARPGVAALGGGGGGGRRGDHGRVVRRHASRAGGGGDARGGGAASRADVGGGCATR